MDFDIPESTLEFRDELRATLREPAFRAALEACHSRSDGMDGDSRPVYRLLGERRLLAPSWPRSTGGRDADFSATLVLLEELVAHGVPQSLYYISVQIVGSLVAQSGNARQKAEMLPALASGELAACILFTEPENGSNLAAIRTKAVRDGAGWVIDGHKKYNLKTAYADVALCAVRTDPDASRYEGITLFLVPTDAPGVTIRPIPSMADEQFHDVRLDGVRVGDDAVVGAPGEGWSQIARMFSAERSGLDYYARATHWLDLATAALGARPAGVPDGAAADLGRHGARVDAGRLLTARVLQRLQESAPDIAEASLSKWHCSETAQRIGWWALEAVGLPLVTLAAGGAQGRNAPPPSSAALESAYREAAGMTISGGASEVLLDVVAGARLLDDPEGQW
jgi:acyl-CoA dehydrogenase